MFGICYYAIYVVSFEMHLYNTFMIFLFVDTGCTRVSINKEFKNKKKEIRFHSSRSVSAS